MTCIIIALTKEQVGRCDLPIYLNSTQYIYFCSKDFALETKENNVNLQYVTGPWQSILLVQTTSSTSRKRLLATTGSIITFWCRALGSNTSTSRRHFRASRQLFLQFATRWLAISIVEDGAHGVGSVHWLQTARAVGGGQCSVRA